ncbi:hypothetical protein EAI_06945, partial [Harpegnathos saltator]
HDFDFVGPEILDCKPYYKQHLISEMY